MIFEENNIFKHVKNYDNQIYDSAGFVAHEKYMMLVTSFNIFSLNFSELKNFIETMNNPQVILEIMKIENRSKHNDVGLLLQRVFSNYLNSALMLVDHARNFTKTYDAECELKVKYVERIKNEFAGNELHRFIQCMRAYMFHYRLPITSQKVQFSKENITQTISLSKGSLLTYDSWNKEAKKWIETQDEEIPLLRFTTDYFEKVKTFYEWFFCEISLYHAGDFEKTNQLIKLCEDLLTNKPNV